MLRLADQRRLMRIDTPTEAELAEVRVRGYELILETAEDLVDVLPDVIAQDTWRTDDHPDRTGWIRVVSMGHQRSSGGYGGGFFSFANDENETPISEFADFPAERYAILVIRQTRAVHKTIEDWLEALHSPVSSVA